MITIKIDGMESIKRKMNDLARRQIPFALVKGLTDTAEDIKIAEEKEIRDVFNRPTPYTQKSVYKKSATKQKLTAVVWLKSDTSKGTPAEKYLLPEIKGGSRRIKRFERALMAAGVLPDGYRAVPGDAAKLDVYGNISPGLIVQILSYFKAFPEAGYKANITDKRKAKLAKGTRKSYGYAYFVGRPGDRLPLGIWQRVGTGFGSAIKPVMIFVPHAQYQALFDFYGVAERTAKRTFDKNLRQALDYAIRTAR